MTRCKFVCRDKKIDENGATIYMSPVTSGSKENDEFFRYTPAGEIRIGIVSLETARQFEEGKEYYIDISPAE